MLRLLSVDTKCELRRAFQELIPDEIFEWVGFIA